MTFKTKRKFDTDDSADYVIPTEGLVNLIYSYNTEKAEFSMHTTFGSFVTEMKADKGLGFVTMPGADIQFASKRIDVYETHGLFMWSTWTLAGFLLLMTKRYTKTNWNFMHYMHALLGYYSTGITIAYAMTVIRHKGKLHAGPHNTSGLVVVVLTIIACILGVASAITKRFNKGKEKWLQKELNVRISKLHKVLSYFLLFFSNIVTFTGVGKYFNDNLGEGQYAAIGIINFFVFCLVVGLVEFCYRKANKNSKLMLDTNALVSKVDKVRNWTVDELE